MTDAAVLGMIVLIRTVLSITIEIEVDGVAPWRKALTTGPQVLARLRESLAEQSRTQLRSTETSTARTLLA